jgi:hypothetical protein
VTDQEVIVSKSLEEFQKKSKKRKKIKITITIFFDFFENSFFKKISEITCTDGIFVPTAHHGRRPKAMPTAKPVPTAIWPVPTPAYADDDMPTVAVGTDCANDIFSCANGYRPSVPCLRPVVYPLPGSMQVRSWHTRTHEALLASESNII